MDVRSASQAEATEISCSVPVRRTRWTSFWIGVAAVIIAALSAALSVFAVGGLLMWLRVDFDGFWVVFMFGLLWFGLFFLSYPLQRRYARSRDLRHPGISFADGKLTVPVARDFILRFDLDEPHELMFGWYEHVMTSAGGATKNSRAVWTHAVLSQAGQQLFLIAEDAIREAQSSRWPKTPDASTQTMPRVQLWASDLVELVEAMRTRVRPTATERHF
ncbi:MAG TPA: hypothetical protein VIQ24_03345 [Pyrinomonadaceae bacterium]